MRYRKLSQAQVYPKLEASILQRHQYMDDEVEEWKDMYRKIPCKVTCLIPGLKRNNESLLG